MPVRQTSIEAYKQVDLSRQQKEVLKAIKDLGETCIADVQTYLNIWDKYRPWERSTISGRMKELKDLKQIILVGKRKSQRTNIRSEFWKVRKEQETLFGSE